MRARFNSLQKDQLFSIARTESTRNDNKNTMNLIIGERKLIKFTIGKRVRGLCGDSLDQTHTKHTNKNRAKANKRQANNKTQKVML